MGTIAVREKIKLLQKSPGEAEVTEYFSYMHEILRTPQNIQHN